MEQKFIADDQPVAKKGESNDDELSQQPPESIESVDLDIEESQVKNGPKPMKAQVKEERPQKVGKPKEEEKVGKMEEHLHEELDEFTRIEAEIRKHEELQQKD